jgi:hypothetical protein
MLLVSMNQPGFVSGDELIIISGGEVQLRITEPYIRGFGQVSTFSSASSASKPVIPKLQNEGIDPEDIVNTLYGSGRPGSQGFIKIEGIGLGGATAIRFEGDGVSGSIVDAGIEGELNPGIFVEMKVELSAKMGPRRFTLITPRGEISSGDVAFMVCEPSVVFLSDPEGSPGTSGEVVLLGVGLDQAQEVRFDGEGLMAHVVREIPLLNPQIVLNVEISSSAPLGQHHFSVVTSHGMIESREVTFNITNPRVADILDGNRFLVPGGEGAPGTSGWMLLRGVGLQHASAIEFSGVGVTGTIDPSFGTGLNVDKIVRVTIAETAPIGPRTFILTIPRGSGVVSSTETGITFTVTAPRIDVLTPAEAAPGSQGVLFIDGVGIGNATGIQFDGGNDMVGSVRVPSPSVIRSLNAGVTVDLIISPTAVLGPRGFHLALPNGGVEGGEINFTASLPRITSVDTRGNIGDIEINPTDAAVGTSGLIRIYGVGLRNVVSVRFSGEGVVGTLEPVPRQGSTLNPYILVRLQISPTVPIGERAIELTLNKSSSP